MILSEDHLPKKVYHIKYMIYLCREWLKDILRCGVAFTASAVHRQFDRVSFVL